MALQYLLHRKQGTTITLEPLPLSIFLEDLLFIMKESEIVPYADDSTPYINAENINKLISCIEEVSTALFKCFVHNCLKVNVSKCRVIVIGIQKYNINLENFCKSNSEIKRHLEIYNQSNNILRLADVLPNFPFTTSETMDD